MPKQQVLNRNGHDEHVWDKSDVVGTKEAMERFAELTKKGHVAIDVEGQRVIKRFDETVETTRFMPQLQGG